MPEISHNGFSANIATSRMSIERILLCLILPVDGRVVRGLIGDLDDDTIALLDVDCRSWEHAVDGEDLLALAELCYPGLLYLHA